MDQWATLFVTTSLILGVTCLFHCLHTCSFCDNGFLPCLRMYRFNLFFFVLKVFQKATTQGLSNSHQYYLHPYTVDMLSDILMLVMFLDQRINVCPGPTLHLTSHIVTMS